MNLSTLFICVCSKVNISRCSRRYSHEGIWNAPSTVLTETTIKEKLTSFSVPFTEGHTCFLIKNCFCQNAESNSDCNIFINKRTGLFLCEQCKVTCDWNMYRNMLEKAKGNSLNLKSCLEKFQRYDEGFAGWNEVLAQSTSLKSLNDEDYRKAFSEFGLVYCSKATSDKLRIRISPARDILYFPLLSSKSSVVGYKTFSKAQAESTFPRLDCPGLLLHSVKPKDAVIVVANIPDFLALISQNLQDYDITCLQYGAVHLPQTTLPFFEKYEKIILWLGVKSLDATGNLSRKFNEKRCYIVRPIGNQVSASVALLRKENFKAILSNAKLAWHQFVTSFSSFRDEVLAQLQNVEETAGVKWKRFPILTKILKGHRRGELTILTGPTGVGKTTFLSEYSLDLAMQGINTLWGSFEIKNITLAKILLTQFARAPLTDNLTIYNDLCDKFEKLPMFFLSFHGQQDISNVMDAINHCSYTYDIAHVVIDNIQFMIDVSSDLNTLDRFWKQDYMIQAFRNFATKNNCHVTLVMHPKKIEGFDLSVNSIFGGVKASQEADNILIIQKKELDFVQTRKHLQVCKNRYDGDLGSFPLIFDKASLSFSKAKSGDHEFRKNQGDRYFVEEPDYELISRG